MHVANVKCPVKCPLGGYAPCVDDLCYSGGTMVCGLEMDFDVCCHGYIPETCDEGCNVDGFDDEPWSEDQWVSRS